MTISYIRFYIFILVSFCWFSGNSQNDFTTFYEPLFAVNHKVSDSYKVNFATKSRSYLYRDNSFEFKVRQLEFIHFSTLSFNSNHSISGGIMYRFRETFDDKSNELRLTQQYNYAYRPHVIRFGHRFRTEQRIQDTKTIHRFRYRFTIDFPLQGEKLDIGEPYIVTNLESLLSVTKTSLPEFDQRFTSQIGWLWSKRLKLQAGLEYRFENYNNATKEILLVLTSVILKI